MSNIYTKFYRNNLDSWARRAHAFYFSEHLSLNEREAIPTGTDTPSATNKFVTSSIGALQTLDNVTTAGNSTANDIYVGNITAVTYGTAVITDTELGYLNNVSSNIQTQLDNIVISGTPLNAVAASSVLTIGTNPVEATLITIGGTAYKFRVAVGAGVAATGTLTMNTDQPHDGDTVLMGNTTYTFKTALSAEPTVANEVLIAATTTEASMDNLIAAIEGTGVEGTNYSVDTLSQGAVTASKATADTMLVTYDTVGTLGNQYDTAGTATHATWGNTTLVGGIAVQTANDVLIGATTEDSINNLVLAITYDAGAGTNEGVLYGTGTVVNANATAVKASPATMTATSLIKGVSGNSIGIAETLADGSWTNGDLFLAGGVNGTVAGTGQLYYDSTNLYIAMTANTISGANWRKLVLQSI